ncbi:MAG: hypothetical protein JWP12_457 [Bacteroidetes bacterium]|nr:hypothetical protein [Bacteroidota bacterium]
MLAHYFIGISIFAAYYKVMNYYLFVDESGDHGLKNIDCDFPVFVLCGVIFSEDQHSVFRERMHQLKTDVWGSKEVIFHSRDIRKCEKEFQVLFDLEKKKMFYERLNAIISGSDYKIISAVIQKDDYIKKYGRLGNVYAICLSFLIERTIFYLDTKSKPIQLEIIVEKRGKLEDQELLKHYNEVHSIGTGYVTSARIKNYNTRFRFKSKKENINGLQLADLVAYPIARHIIEPSKINPAFNVLEAKFYEEGGKRYGLKKYP